MSGTSCDGLDIAGLKINSNREKPDCELAFFEQHHYAKALKECLLHLAVADCIDLDYLWQLEIELMHVYTDMLAQTLHRQQISADQVVAIGVHGQTIRHRPVNKFPYTIQLCEPALLAATTGIDTISHFRQSDIANGGQGAPLAPIFHRQLLEQSKTRSSTDSLTNNLVLNLGGIANLSCFYADGRQLAFDTGPANTLLDAWVREKKLHPKGYDENGQLSEQGNIHTGLLHILLDEPYFTYKTPKSTGRELFNLSWLEQKIHRMTDELKTTEKLSDMDILTTLSALTVRSIIHSIPNEDATIWHNLYLCGGGVHNDFLIDLFKHTMHQHYPDISVDLLENQSGIDSQSIEAGAWAWLAYLYQQDLALDLQSMTGSQRPSILGRLSKG